MYINFQGKRIFIFCSQRRFRMFPFSSFLFAYMCNSYGTCADEILYVLKQLKHL